MQLSIKTKDFFTIFYVIFQNLDEVLNTLQKKMRTIANVFPKLPNPKNADRKISKKCRFRVAFNKQHGKRTRTLFKSERREFYHVY